MNNLAFILKRCGQGAEATKTDGEMCLGMGLGGPALARSAYIDCLLYLVALLPLPLFFRFVVLATVHLYDLL